MLRFLCFNLIFPILFCAGANVMIDLFSQASTIKFYKDGQELVLSTEEQEKFEDLFCQAIENSLEKPAYSVSLHDQTVEAMKEGFWVKFIFNQTMVKHEMPFDELLIHIEQDCHGLNVIRGNNGKYEGRCFYLDLEGTLDDVYNFLNQIEIETKQEIELESQEIKETSVEQENKHVNENENEQEKLNDENTIANKDTKAENQDNSSDEKKNIVINQNPNSEENLSKSQQELLNHLS